MKGLALLALAITIIVALVVTLDSPNTINMHSSPECCTDGEVSCEWYEETTEPHQSMFSDSLTCPMGFHLLTADFVGGLGVTRCVKNRKQINCPVTK